MYKIVGVGCGGDGQRGYEINCFLFKIVQKVNEGVIVVNYGIKCVLESVCLFIIEVIECINIYGDFSYVLYLFIVQGEVFLLVL